MDKDRIEGAANQAKGSIKETAGKITGDAKLQTEGAADKAAGKVQNAVGGVNRRCSRRAQELICKHTLGRPGTLYGCRAFSLG